MSNDQINKVSGVHKVIVMTSEQSEQIEYPEIEKRNTISRAYR